MTSRQAGRQGDWTNAKGWSDEAEALGYVVGGILGNFDSLHRGGGFIGSSLFRRMNWLPTLKAVNLEIQILGLLGPAQSRRLHLQL